MNKTPRKIDINQWYSFGGGHTAESFYHNTDDSIMMKLYAPFMRPEDPLIELETAENVAALGIPTAKALEYVQSEDRYGAIFERLKNKRSIARILCDEPERLDEMAQLLAEQGKALHNTPCDTKVFPSKEDKLLEDITRTDLLSEKLKKEAIDIIKATPKSINCLHGDFHIGNLILTDERYMFIDLGDFAYGNSLYDLGMLCFTANHTERDLCLDMYHITPELYLEFWQHFKKYYFGTDDLAIDAKLKPYVFLTALFYTLKIGHMEESLESVISEYI